MVLSDFCEKIKISRCRWPGYCSIAHSLMQMCIQLFNTYLTLDSISIVPHLEGSVVRLGWEEVVVARPLVHVVLGTVLASLQWWGGDQAARGPGHGTDLIMAMVRHPSPHGSQGPLYEDRGEEEEPHAGGEGGGVTLTAASWSWQVDTSSQLTGGH